MAEWRARGTCPLPAVAGKGRASDMAAQAVRAVMLAVTLLLDRDLGLGHPVSLPGPDVSSQTVTVRQR